MSVGAGWELPLPEENTPIFILEVAGLEFAMANSYTALKAVSHNYPIIVSACWEQVSAIVYHILSTVTLEAPPSRQSSEHVGSPTAFINEKVTVTAIKVLDESLRAVSGFQGTEDLSDDKLMDIPFASDCIRMKKVSSAPSYDVEGKADVIVNFEAPDSGIRQWCEAIEKHMPLILCHSSAMIVGLACGVDQWEKTLLICLIETKCKMFTSAVVGATTVDNRHGGCVCNKFCNDLLWMLFPGILTHDTMQETNQSTRVGFVRLMKKIMKSLNRCVQLVFENMDDLDIYGEDNKLYNVAEVEDVVLAFSSGIDISFVLKWLPTIAIIFINAWSIPDLSKNLTLGPKALRDTDSPKKSCQGNIHEVRAASITCFAGMTSSVFMCFTKEKQDFILSSLMHAALRDNVPSVRSAACRAIGIISCFPQVCQSAEVLDKFIHAVEINTHDTLISVRITASWALANICDAICHSDRILPFGQQMGSISKPPHLIESLSECALHLTKDGDKVKSNAVRALGYISRILKCSTSKFPDTPMDHHNHMNEAFLNSKNLMVCQQRCVTDSLQDLNRLERIVHAFISCITTGNVKVQWNVCHALGNLFLNETLRLQDMDWSPLVFGILLQLLHDSSNFKIRIQAAAALAVPVSVLDYGQSFSKIVQSVEHVLENIDKDQMSGPSNFKYRISLQKQLTLTMLHVLQFISSSKDQQLKDFLVMKALILEDWFKGLCSSSEGMLDVHDSSIADRKRVMICSALRSLIEVYREKQQDAIAEKFQELKNSM
ncbi:unnamed protein product [Sphenostylis stenocarpa]|uniref:HEAT repeat-containing protein 6 n=1 Tax=Sphenostylis stenocarpa TaxID=92480 RepID=A0AA86W5R4_9FABA|nr:unnamed protein product [Sphenostylis stenocarpa]